TSPEAQDKQRIRKRGSSLLFNAQALKEDKGPIVIVEGEIDALSVIDAGGVAVGLGSLANRRQLIEAVEKSRPQQRLIISLDNDPAGKAGTEDIARDLTRMGVQHTVFNVSGAWHDPNEALTKDREAFINKIANLVNVDTEALELEQQAYQTASNFHHLLGFMESIDTDTPFIPTGFNKLDKVMGDGLYEGLYIVGAVPSLGKTAFTLQMADQMAESGQDVLMICLEMSRNEMIARTLSRLTLLYALNHKLDAKKIPKTGRDITTRSRYDNYDHEESKAISQAITDYERFAKHIYIIESLGEIKASEIRDLVRKHILFTGNRPVVIVDYLQILSPADPRASDKSNMDTAVKELKHISRDYKIPVLAISSLNRKSYDEEITFEAFKESGAIEYGSDVLMGLFYQGEDKEQRRAEKKQPVRQVKLVVLKNRHGDVGQEVVYSFYPKYGYFKEET
ncbi:MAG TPA: bifunctional DNA primase/helicase, partial [Rectinema sp.]|nr:bifunctional DNA primase/helicase [Rectinema sp.]